MPLTNAPFGFRPVRHLAGGDCNRARQYPIATGYNTALIAGDPVKLLTDGTIALAAATNRVLGIFQGVQYTDANGNVVFTNSWPASTTATNIKASVIDDPHVIFEVMSGGTPTQSDVGALADHVTGTGSALTGTSAASLNGTSATTTKQWRILKLVDKPGNSGQYAVLEVMCQQHEFSIEVGATPGV